MCAAFKTCHLHISELRADTNSAEASHGGLGASSPAPPARSPHLMWTEPASCGQHSSMALRSRDSAISGPCGGQRHVATGRDTTGPPPCSRLGPDLQQRQQQPVEPPPLQQAELRAGAAQLAEQHQQGHLVRGDPVADAEHVGVHDAVREHRVEVKAVVHARHGGTGPPVTRETARAAAPANHRPRRRRAHRAATNQRRGCAPPPRDRRNGTGATETFRAQKGPLGEGAAPPNCPACLALQPGRGWGQRGDGLRLGPCIPEELSAR